MKNSPLNQLTAEDIARKKIKLQKIKDQQNPEHEDYRANPKKQERLAEKLHKTKYQIDTGKRGKPTTLKNEAWLAGPSRKSALNMLGIQPKSPLNNGDLDFDVDYSGAKPVDLGPIKPTERGKKIKAIKKDVSEWDHDKNKLALPKEHDYFVSNPTEESDVMAVKIQDAKNITKAGGPYPQGIGTKGEHYVKVEKPLQEELSEKMLLKNRRNK